MDPWYKVTTPRTEVREGRSFNPDEFAIALEQVTAGTAVLRATTLDRVHAAMLLQAGGQAGALRALVEAETQRSSDFLRLANALSAFYPKDSEEKRLLDAMLLPLPH